MNKYNQPQQKKNELPATGSGYHPDTQKTGLPAQREQNPSSKPPSQVNKEKKNEKEAPSREDWEGGSSRPAEEIPGGEKNPFSSKTTGGKKGFVQEDQKREERRS